GRDKNEKWPLLLFLHGAGERGEELELVKRHAIPRMIEDGQEFPFIAVTPQCPADSYWDMHFDTIDELLKELEVSYSIDSHRIYLTGISMGGFGAFDLAMAYPDRFAAVVPVCGGANYPELAQVIRDVPVWVFHGAKDEAVPVEESERVVEELKACGGNVKFTVYPENGHDVCSLAYMHRELFSWLLEQKRP
ncbi:MAG TPA: prolyl oligopeptidase family serine peptidase, partial [Candidatus Nitrosocosmicus sp.]|nr:prolyl oligopeptidase family serine peptidase [Candidatus Nitrosocosmicus sp.]